MLDTKNCSYYVPQDIVCMCHVTYLLSPYCCNLTGYVKCHCIDHVKWYMLLCDPVNRPPNSGD